MSSFPSKQDAPANERWSRAFRLLSDESRRTILVALSRVPAERRIPLPDAAVSPDSSINPETLSIQLRHNHLPKLSNAGYVQWGVEPFYVQRGPNFDEVETIISVLIDSVEQFPEKLIDGCYVLEQEVY